MNVALTEFDRRAGFDHQNSSAPPVAARTPPLDDKSLKLGKL